MTENDVRYLVTLIIVMAVAAFAKYVMKWSAKEFIGYVVREFADLLSRKPTPGAINALGILVSFLFLGSSIFIPSFDKLLRLGNSIPTQPASVAIPIFGGVFILLGTLICVHLVRGSAE